MIKLNNKTRYGVRAMMQIGSNYGLRPTKKKEVVASTGIPGGYLENILVILRNAGLIDATRGANGGFILRKSPDMLTMFEIVEALNGPSDLDIQTDLVDCISEQLWSDVQDAQNAVLKKKTLSDLIEANTLGGSLGYGI